jgi:hypothetical protein
MEKYDYFKALEDDIKEYIENEYTTEELKEHLGDRDTFYDKLHDDLWVCDSVTGNASGSYTFSTWDAEENLCHNLDLLGDALSEFGDELGKALEKGAEYCDVTIRCYLLGSVLYQVLNELERGMN